MTQTITDAHGNYRPDLPAGHPDNQRLLPRVAQQVASEFRNSAGLRGFGYEVARVEDIFQRMILKMLEAGVTVEDLDHPEAQGKVRLFARNAAYREVEGARANSRNGEGDMRLNLTSYNSPSGESFTTDEALSMEAMVYNPSSLGNPEKDLTEEHLQTKVELLAEDLLSKVSEAYREDTTLYFYEGLGVGEIAEQSGRNMKAVGKAIQRGRRSLHEDEVASLMGIRAYFHPEAKRPGRMTPVGRPTALLDLVT